MKTWDAVVIGGGVAGLAAAEALGRAGARVLLLEARGALGGRIRTVRPRGWPVPVELGAEFVHGRRSEIFDLARGGGLVIGRVPNVHVEPHGGAFRPMGDVWKRFESATRRMRNAGEDRSVADFLRAHRSLSRRDRRLVTSIVEGYDAAPAERASEKAISAAGEEPSRRKEREQFRVLSGYDGVVRALEDRARSAGCRIELASPVAEIAWRSGRVEVTAAAGRRIRARRVVVTLPIGVLQAPPGSRGAVAFRPVPPALRRALSGIEMGHVVRIVLQFRQAFWRERLGEHGDAAFIHAPSGRTFQTLWTSEPLALPALTLWAGGPLAVRLLGLGPEATVEAAVETVATLFRARASRVRSLLVATHRHDWSGDPFSRGAYSYAAVGGSGAAALLARPIERTLYFAGEATAPDESGTVPGAIASGRRAARQVLEADC